MRPRPCRPPLPLIPRSRPEFPRAVPDFPWPALMPFIIDDRFHSHRKVMAVSLAARGLWATAGSWSADHGTDGVVEGHVVAALGGTPDVIAELVRENLWKKRGRKFEFHDWAFWNSPRAEEAPVAEAPAVPPSAAEAAAVPACPAPTSGARRVALHRVPGLKKKLRARDADQCRYCARQVRWGRGRAADSAVWDWVEPGGPASPENVVVACKACGGAKAGRPLKDSGMVLLPVPAPGKRNASGDADCNASDLGEQARNAYSGNGNAYSGETAGQKRYGKTGGSRSDLDQDQSSPVSSNSSHPELDARARKAKPGSAEFRLHVIAAFAARHRTEITGEEADSLAAEVLGRAKGRVPCPLGYVLTAIETEKNPFARWFPHRNAPAAEPRKPADLDWCGKCDPVDRRVYNDAGQITGHCPDCSPRSFAAWEAIAS